MVCGMTFRVLQCRDGARRFHRPVSHRAHQARSAVRCLVGDVIVFMYDRRPSDNVGGELCGDRRPKHDSFGYRGVRYVVASSLCRVTPTSCLDVFRAS